MQTAIWKSGNEHPRNGIRESFGKQPNLVIVLEE